MYYSRHICHKFVFFAHDTMGIILSPNIFIRVQYLIIFFFQEVSDFLIFEIIMNFRIYAMHSTHVPKIHVQYILASGCMYSISVPVSVSCTTKLIIHTINYKLL
jgi:hypothetical protein